MSYASLLDIKLRQDPDGQFARKIIEFYQKTDGIIDDMVFEECNDGSTHLTTVRTGLPEATWRRLYQGVASSKSTTAQVRDATGMLEARSTIDIKVPGLRAGGETARAFRFTEEAPFRMALKNDVVSTLFYGNAGIDVSKFTGIAARFNTRNAATETSENVIHGGGTGNDNTSIYIHTWGGNYGRMLYPHGSSAGISARDLMEGDELDADGNPYRALRTLYGWDCGYALGDWQGVVRIANIDVSDLTKNASAGADLVDLITQGLELLPEDAMNHKVAIYCNRTIRGFLRRQIQNRDNVWLSWGEVAGKKVVMYDNIPVRRCDSIINTEALVPT